MIKSEKGKKGGNCNVTRCQKPGAMYFNKSTEKYYCESCAGGINWPGGRAFVMENYGTPLLCEYEGWSTAEEWKACCATRLKELLGHFTEKECLGYAEACFENVNQDLEEDPIEMAEEEYFAWQQD